jgi:hypothetical protein
MKVERKKGKGGIMEKKCSVCGEWKPETDEYFYKTKKTGLFREECKICTAPFQKYRVESNKGAEAPRKMESSQIKKLSKELKEPVLLSKRHTYKMNPETIEKIDIISNVSGMEKGEIITLAVDSLIENNKKYEMMVAQYKKLIHKFRG